MIKFGESGSALLYVLAGPSGQGHETVYPEVVGEALGMDPEKITLRASDPGGPTLIGEGTIGSRSMMAHGGSLLVAAREVVRRGPSSPRRTWKWRPPISSSAKAATTSREPISRVGIEEVLGAKKPSGGARLTQRRSLPRSFPSGAHVAEVEIDPDTGVVGLLRYTAVDDCGRLINHTLLVGGQVHGAHRPRVSARRWASTRSYDPVAGQLDDRRASWTTRCRAPADEPAFALGLYEELGAGARQSASA